MRFVACLNMKNKVEFFQLSNFNYRRISREHQPGLPVVEIAAYASKGLGYVTLNDINSILTVEQHFQLGEIKPCNH